MVHLTMLPPFQAKSDMAYEPGRYLSRSCLRRASSLRTVGPRFRDITCVVEIGHPPYVFACRTGHIELRKAAPLAPPQRIVVQSDGQSVGVILRMPIYFVKRQANKIGWPSQQSKYKQIA
jgi:hypothetical protein